MTATAEGAQARFRAAFGAEPAAAAQAPGRVNLIGEHVDYVGGLVLPAAVDRFLAVAVAPAQAWGFESEVAGGEKYVRALAAELGTGPLRVAIASDIPAGAGLSSSAALLVALAAALAPALDGPQAARLCQRAEQAAGGVRVGIMDQYASALGRAGFALLLNCATLDHQLVPFPAGLVIGVLDSGVSRDLAETPYNARRAEAEAALAGSGGALGARRLHHVLGEVARVGEFVAALEAGDHRRLGRLLDASHASLRDDFEVSTPEVEAAVVKARAIPGCLGARVMGAGFGGSVLALLETGSEDAFAGIGGIICHTATGPFAHS